MKQIGFNDSAILQEFGRIMQEKDGIKKIAQDASATAKAELEKLYFGALQQTPNNEAYWNKAKQLAQQIGDQNALTAINSAHAAYQHGDKDYAKYFATQTERDAFDDMPIIPKEKLHVTPAPSPHVVPKVSSRANAYNKTAEQKAYDVTPKEDMIAAAHPKSALVNGDVVENKSEQQKADLAVAQKSAQLKTVVAGLYRLAKRLEAEKNMKAYKLVKATFLELAGDLKKTSSR